MPTSSNYAELHLHLEGCLDADTLLEIEPSLNREDVQARLRFDDFAGFLESFKFAVLQLQSVDAYRLLARRALARLRPQGIVYVEVIHSAGVCLWRKHDARAIVEALIEEGRRADLKVCWVLDGVRQFGGDHLMEVARLAADFAGAEVVGLGVGGNETGCPARDLIPAFQLAKQKGLKVLPHAGETSTAENVWEALSLGADRIGHGIRAIEDPRLVQELAQRQIPLEISLTSNVLTGAVPSYEAHPLVSFVRAGVPVVLNTDDPAFFHTTLVNEFAQAQKLGLSAAELEQIRRNGFRFAAGAAPMP